METYEYRGYWWLPTNEARKVNGAFTFSARDGIRVDLDGSLVDLTDAVSKGTEIVRYPVVLGVTTTGKNVTLHDCWQSHFSLHVPGMLTQRLGARIGYIGAHFDDGSTARFDRVMVHYNRLPDWVHQRCFQTTPPGRRPDGGEKFEAVYIAPQDMTGETPGGTVRLRHGLRRDEDFDTLNVQRVSWIEIESRQPLGIEEYISDFVSPIRDLLVLATCRPTELTRFRAVPTRRAKATSTTLEPVDVILGPRYCDLGDGKRLMPQDMLFTLNDIGPKFGDIIRQWLMVAKELKSVCNLHFGVMFQREPYVEHQFLNRVLALEAYHRRRFPNQVLPEEDHAERLKSIIAQAPSGHREWLREQLRYSNEPRLRRRLKDLLGTTADIMSPLVVDVPGFISRVVTARNQLIHRNGTRGLPRPAKLDMLGQELFFLVQALLLLELGFSAPGVRELLDRNSEFGFLRSRVTSE